MVNHWHVDKRLPKRAHRHKQYRQEAPDAVKREPKQVDEHEADLHDVELWLGQDPAITFFNSFSAWTVLSVTRAIPCPQLF